MAAYLEGAGSKGEKTLSEILAPIWDGWLKSDLTDDQVDELLLQELKASRRDKKQAKAPT